MEREIGTIMIREQDAVLKAKAAFEAVNLIVHRLKEHVRNYEFRDTREEILFFKEIKPQFYHQLIYYGELTVIESNRPPGDRKKVIRYLRKVIEANHAFVERNHIIHSYHKLGHDAGDQVMFTRSSERTALYPDYGVDMDAMFSNRCSAVLSKLIAFEKLNDHLAREIELLKKGPKMPATADAPPRANIVWTDSKAALVELGYALLARGSLNFGKAGLNQIMQTLMAAFNAQAGNYYRTFSDLSGRKKARTPFLDSLKENLERKMDELL